MGERLIKKRIIFSVIAAIVVLGAIALFVRYGQKDTVSHKKTQLFQYKIVALGDSLTKGVGDLKGQGYVGATSRALKKDKNVSRVTTDDFGHAGDTSADLLEKLKQPKIRAKVKAANTIFLTIGGNDIMRVFQNHFLDLHETDFTKEQKHFTTNLQTALTEIRKLNPHAPIYYFGLYNPFEDYLGEANKDFIPILNKWNESSKRMTEKFAPVSFIPTSDLFREKTDRLLYKDHFHPNKKGYAEMARRLLSSIKKNQEKSAQQ